MPASSPSNQNVSRPALLGWSLFTIAIVWLALAYSASEIGTGIDSLPERTHPELQVVDFLVGLFFTTPYIIIAVVCFGGANRDKSTVSSTIRSARNGFRIAVACLFIPCVFVLFVFTLLGSSPAGNLVYGMPEGAIVGIGIISLLLLAAGAIGAFLGSLWGVAADLSGERKSR